MKALADLRTKNQTIFLPICFFKPKVAAGENNDLRKKNNFLSGP